MNTLLLLKWMLLNPQNIFLILEIIMQYTGLHNLKSSLYSKTNLKCTHNQNIYAGTLYSRKESNLKTSLRNHICHNFGHFKLILYFHCMYETYIHISINMFLYHIHNKYVNYYSLLFIWHLNFYVQCLLLIKSDFKGTTDIQ